MKVGHGSTLVKTDQKGFVLDKESGAVLNNDKGDWDRYQAERKKAVELAQLKSDVSELKAKVQYLERLIQEKLQ